MTSSNLLGYAQRLNALAENGLAFTQNEYDKERYVEIRAISQEILATLCDVPLEKMIELIPSDMGYQTPKVDIRAVVLNTEAQLLMVQEKVDHNKWTLPGGWGDVGYTPFEVAQKEVFEETGLQVKPTRLLAVFDKKMHPHPPQPWYVYKFFILCEVTGGELLADTIETGDASWIRTNELSALPLSTNRVTLSQLQTVIEIALNPGLPALCD
ncbi:NUDIX hydrolase [Dyadobacter luteus]|uniref:NUDIX hydrolase n=1 Tax=Dyadobacter luteus TaxID=2259619 RepID=A0A3D8Y304_9BACT|nr:NUDIX hydrolase [Dyadobacter luteus]REA56126.1 NUDIX hydrolase [Dyadobacter luteus]